MKFSCIIFLTLPGLFLSHGAFSQSVEKIDTAAVSKIKNEGFMRSQLMSTLQMLTDVHGPRLTNSPNYFKAAAYTKNILQEWGIENVHLDKWDEVFGTGWEIKKFSILNISPNSFPVLAFPKAWSPGVKGTVIAEAVYLDIVKEEDLSKYKGKLKGKIVLFSLPSPLKPGFAPDAVRLNDSTLLSLANSPASDPGGRRYSAPAEPQRLAYLKWQLCETEGAVAVLEASPRFKDGIITLASATVPYPAETPNYKRLRPYSVGVPKILPQIVVGAEHYNQMVRQLQQGISVKIELTLETEFTDASPGVNVIGEITGTDLKDEVVLIGAHLDSWHAATGTTDNAAGVAVMMEAMRIIKTLGIRPRRTIRVALWGGEEQGLLGSQNYAGRNLGRRFDRTYPYDSILLTPAGKKLSVYFNMDLGTGKFRGVYLQGNEAVRPIFRTWMAPFGKQGMTTLTIRNITGTDHLTFDAIGLPSFQFIQDPIEYGTTTYHSNMDVFEKAIEGDLKHNAVVMATFAWMAANRDGLLPRK
jgi:hypothetical protein